MRWVRHLSIHLLYPYKIFVAHVTLEKNERLVSLETGIITVHMPKFQMGYDVSTGEVIRADSFTERAKLPEPTLSRSAKRRQRKKERAKEQGKALPQTTRPLMPAPQNWGWNGMNEYLFLIKHLVEQLATTQDTTTAFSRIEAGVVAYLTLLFLMSKARADQSDLVWVDRLEDLLGKSELTQPYLTHITTYRNGWSEPKVSSA